MQQTTNVTDSNSAIKKDQVISKTILKTPSIIKQLFKEFLFPVGSNKTPAIKQGETWLYKEKQTKEDKKLIRSIENFLCGLDCGQAQLSVIDIDIYKDQFKQNKQAQIVLKHLIKHCKHFYRTPRGGYHFFLKNTIFSKEYFKCIEIKSKGGYIVLWDNPAKLITYDNFQDFKEDLIDINSVIHLFNDQKNNSKVEFGPGQNNSAAASLGFTAGLKTDPTLMTEHIIEMIKNNEGRNGKFDFKNTLNKYLKSVFDGVIEKQKQLKKNSIESDKDFWDDLKTIPIKDLKYLDKNKLFLKGFLTVQSGEKGSLKSRGTLSYLLENNLKVGYFSDNENTKATIKKVAIACNKLHNLKWIHFDKQNDKNKKDFWLKIANVIKELEVDIVFEDPCYETIDFGNPQGLREVLGKRVSLADTLDVGWLVTRNHSKNETKILIDKVNGFKIFTNMPRAVLSTFSIEKNSKAFKKAITNSITKEGPLKLSLLQTIICNEGPLPQKSILMALEKRDNGEIFFTFNTIDRIQDPEKYCKDETEKEKAKKQEAKDKIETIKLSILVKLKNTKGMQSGDLKDDISEKHNVSKRRITDFLKELKTANFITGGGSGPYSEKYTITSAGEDWINKD